MKLRFVILIFFLPMFAFASTLSLDDFSIVIENTEIQLGQPITSIREELQILGAEGPYRAPHNCYSYFLNNVEIRYLKASKSITAIIIKNPEISSLRGISLGDNRLKIKDHYNLFSESEVETYDFIGYGMYQHHNSGFQVSLENGYQEGSTEYYSINFILNESDIVNEISISIAIDY